MKTDRDTIEQIIDANSFRAVLDMIEEICFAKEEHLRTNWQDKEQAKVWFRRAKMIQKVHTEDGKKHGDCNF